MASIKDVAEMAGVSLSTASIVVNGKAEERKISEKTQRRVLQTMQELNYIPNVSAKTLRKGESQSYIVALFWHFDFRAMIMHRFLSGMQQRIAETGANISVIVHPYRTGSLQKNHANFQGGEFHAAIIANAGADDLAYLQRENFPIPIILYNRQLDGYCSVNVDDRKMGFMAADHLYRQGYRRPCVIHGLQSFPGATRRNEGFVERMQEYGTDIAEREIIRTDSSLCGGFECGTSLLKQMKYVPEEQMPDSFFCSSDFIAMGLVNAWAGTDLVPEKIGVIAVGNNDPQYSMYHAPSLTVINMPIEEMGAECCQLLIDRMYLLRPEPVQKFFETRLFARKSTARTGGTDTESRENK